MLPDTDFSASRLLIVDDEPANVALLQYMLRVGGYEAVQATTDPREAMAVFDQFRPDLVLLDLTMAHLDGFQLMELIRQRVPVADCLPILVLTADITEETKHRALAAGASDFLTKPFDQVEALLRIRHLLHDRAQHQAIARQRDGLEEAVAARTSELRQTCQYLEETLDELRQTQQQMIQHERMSALGTMAAGLAHDFNNSLSLILGYSELLQSDLVGTPYEAHSDEFLGTIITAAQDAARMFNRLRTFYRAQDEDEDRHAGLDLNALIEQTVTMTRPRWQGLAVARGAEIHLSKELAPWLPPLLADATELREMLTNLIFNAVDAMPHGGALTLRTRHEQPTLGEAADAIVLEVADTGVGMDDETRRRCLEPFFTTKGAKGTGLGLAMVYGTVQRHEGSIDLRSRPGEGACFTLRLPLRRSDGEGASASQPSPATQMPLRVLVADDQPVLAQILQRYLKADGHTVEIAPDGQTALAKFHGGDFDLVITDQRMPGMTGEELAMAVKAETPAVPVLLISGFGGMDAARPSAVDLALIKPVTHAALRSAVRQVMSAAVRPVPAVPVATERRTRLLPSLRSLGSRLRLTTTATPQAA